MKLYVASNFYNKDQVRDIYARLKAMGHTITHDWTFEDDGTSEPSKCAYDDAKGVLDADALLMVPYPGARGTWVEMGLMLYRQLRGEMVPTIIVDTGETCIFATLLNVVTVPDLEAAYHLIEKIRGEFDDEKNGPESSSIH